ncbi:MAG: M20/M25/M40 family metallo-hydrolase [Bacteroidota bacterium]
MKTSRPFLSAIFSAFFLLIFQAGFSQPDPDLTKEIFKELIEINTTHSVGSTTKAAEAMAARLKAAGFTDKDLFIGGPSEKRGNLVATLRGSGKRKPLLLVAHLDVVEALASDWGTDPFKFQEKDGFYYARGTSDDKAMAAIWIANLIRFKKEKFTPDRDIIVALTADEEGGPENGVDWLIKNHKDLINSEYALNEGGGGEEKNGKKIANGIQLSEKVPQSFQLEVKNKGGHSSMPRQDNAINQLAKALDNLAHFQFPGKSQRGYARVL